MLVIFDCDGVLVDSEMIASRELAAYLTDLGRPTRGQECREAFTGISLSSVAAKTKREWGLELPDDFVAQLRARDKHAFERDLKAIPGVERVLDTLKAKGISSCVASSGIPEKIHHSLSITGLLPRFDGHLFSATQVEHGKPAPDLFLFAAARMGASAKDCVVVEDSPAGISGALAADMRVLGFSGGSHCGPDYADKLKDAEAVFDHMSELPGLLK